MEFGSLIVPLQPLSISPLEERFTQFSQKTIFVIEKLMISKLNERIRQIDLDFVSKELKTNPPIPDAFWLLLVRTGSSQIGWFLNWVLHFYLNSATFTMC